MTVTKPGAVEAVAYIGLGANLGDARNSLQNCFIELAQMPSSKLLAKSNIYRSAALGTPDAQPDYYNAVAKIHTALSAPALLKQLQLIEARHGRQRQFKNAARTLDLDLLIYGQEKIHSDALQVPHPRMGERAFVLLPLAEIADNDYLLHLGSISGHLASLHGQRIVKLAE